MKRLASYASRISDWIRPQKCPNCGSENVVKIEEKGGQCLECGHPFHWSSRI